MNISESELIKVNGWKKKELRKIRKETKEFEGHLLWYIDNENRPKIYQKIYWTPIGIIFLREYFFAKMKIVEDAIKSIPDDIIENGAMTKGQFNKVVNNSRWIGKVSRNTYRNNKIILVEHETGFKVLTKCKNNLLYPKNKWVIVDTLENNHSIKKQSFKSYEKAKEEKTKL
jgi:hypothetical protein